MEQRIMLLIQEHRNSVLDIIMKIITHLGDGGAIWLAIGIGLSIPEKTRHAGLLDIVCVAVSALITNLILKNMVGRTRPYEIIEGLKILISPESSNSFPSGHSCASFAAATAIFLCLRGDWAWMYLPATLIAFSRVYLGVHYPSDVLAGAVVGTLVSVLGYRLSLRFFSVI